MEPIAKETFITWAKENNWLPVNEGTHPQGRQTMFVTPSGNLIFVIYDLKGNLLSFGQPMAQPPQPLPMMKGPPFHIPRG